MDNNNVGMNNSDKNYCDSRDMKNVKIDSKDSKNQKETKYDTREFEFSE